MSEELDVARAEIMEVVKFHLQRIASGRILTAKQFIELEEELKLAVTKGAAIGERYAHEKPTIKAPRARKETIELQLPNESGTLPVVQTRTTRKLGSDS